MKLREHLDRLYDRMTKLEVVSAKQEANLQDHMRRTAATEEALEILKNELLPIKAHVSNVERVIKFVVTLGSGVALAALTSWLL